MNNITTEQPELRYIPVTDLFVDPRYQRSTETKKIRKNIDKIRDNWDWTQVGALNTFQSGNRYAITDGQCRWLAALERGDIAELPCAINREDSLESQAQSFIGINRNRVVLTNIANYYALITAGDAEAKEVSEFLKECEFTVPKNPVSGGETEPYELQCIQAIGDLFAESSKNQIKWALTIIPEAYGERRGMMRSCLIKMLAKFIKATPRADRDIAVRTLRAIEPKTFESDSRMAKKIHGGSTVLSMLAAFEREYRRFGGRATELKPVKQITIAELEKEREIKTMKTNGLSLAEICDKFKAETPGDKQIIAHVFFQGTNAKPVHG